MRTRESAATVRRFRGVTMIDLDGDVNAASGTALDTAWDTATRTQPDAVVLNFSGAGYINSTGIALIVALLAKARAGGIEIRAFGLTPHYREIFEITRLADFLAIHADEESALRGAERSTHA